MDYKEFLIKLLKKRGISKEEFYRKAGISAGYARNIFMPQGPVPSTKLVARIVEGLAMTTKEQENFQELLEGTEARGRASGFKALEKYVEKHIPEPQLPPDEVAEIFPVGAIREKKPQFNWEKFYGQAEQKEAALTLTDSKGNVIFERDDLGGVNKLWCPFELEPSKRYRWQVEQILMLDDGSEKKVRSPEMSFHVLDEAGALEEYALERDLRAGLVLQAIKKRLYGNALRELAAMAAIMPDDEAVKSVTRALREYIFTNPY
jgi:hypothetical protein